MQGVRIYLQGNGIKAPTYMLSTPDASTSAGICHTACARILLSINTFPFYATVPYSPVQLIT
jgi:hypothetical protein